MGRTRARVVGAEVKSLHGCDIREVVRAAWPKSLQCSLSVPYRSLVCSSTAHTYVSTRDEELFLGRLYAAVLQAVLTRHAVGRISV